MVRPELVKRKLQLIAQDLGRLIPFREMPAEELAGDAIRAAAAERMIERIVMRAIDVNTHLIAELATGSEEKTTRLTYRDTFLALVDLDVYPSDLAERLARSAGFRNLLVHDYNDLDRSIIFGAIGSSLEDYSQYVEHVGAFVEHLENQDG